MQKDTCGSVVFLRLLGASTWYDQGRAPIQKGGYVAAWRSEREKIERKRAREGGREEEKDILVTPVTLSIPLWRRIRNSGDDPTTVFGDSPSRLAFSSHRHAFVSSLFLFCLSLFPRPICSILVFPFPSALFFLCYSTCSSFLSFGVSLYKAPYFPLVYILLVNNQPSDALLPHPFLPRLLSRFRETFPRRSIFFVDLHLLDFARSLSIAPLFFHG